MPRLVTCNSQLPGAFVTIANDSSLNYCTTPCVVSQNQTSEVTDRYDGARSLGDDETGGGAPKGPQEKSTKSRSTRRRTRKRRTSRLLLSFSPHGTCSYSHGARACECECVQPRPEPVGFGRQYILICYVIQMSCPRSVPWNLFYFSCSTGSYNALSLVLHGGNCAVEMGIIQSGARPRVLAVFPPNGFECETKRTVVLEGAQSRAFGVFILKLRRRTVWCQEITTTLLCDDLKSHVIQN